MGYDVQRLSSSDDLNNYVLWKVLKVFLHVDTTIRKEQKDCFKRLSSKLVFGKRCLRYSSKGFGKSLIFEVFPSWLINALQRNLVSTIIMVTLLVAIMKDQVESFKALELEQWLSE